VLAVRSPTILVGAILAWLLAGGIITHPAFAETEPALIFCKPSLPFAKANRDAPPADDSRGFDVLSYDLELTIDPSDRSIAGDLLVRLAAVDRGIDFDLQQIHIDLVPELNVTSIVDALGPLNYDHLNNVLNISLRQPLPIGSETTLTISWAGQPQPHGSFRAGLMFRTHDPGTPLDPSDDQPIVANLSQTWSAHSWWPCKDHPADKALVSVAITVPDNLSAVSNGSLQSLTPTSPGWHRYAWSSQYPMPTYLVSVAVSNYETWSENCLTSEGSDVRLDFHVFPFDRQRAEYDLARSCQMMQHLTDLLGPWPYGDEKYAQVEFKWVGGMEHTTATSLAQLLFTGDRRFENLFLHEMAHQWFGDSLTPSSWADVWLNEGFARYFEALWVEAQNGPAAYLEFMATIGPVGHPELFLGAGILSDPNPILPNTLVYDKGAWVLHMLRQVIGDDAFFRFLYDFANDPQLVHGSVENADLIRVAESAAGRTLEKFFQPWLTTDLTPIVSHTLTSSESAETVVTLQQHQDPIFEVPVPLILHSDCGETEVTLVLSQAVQSFQLQTSCKITAITVAPSGSALIRSLSSPPPLINAVGPAPNPSGAAGAAFDLFLTKDTLLVVNTYDTKGRLVQSSDLGELTATGPEGPGLAAAHSWRWQPRLDNGALPPSGLYFVEFVGGGGRTVKRVTLLR
jgi:aminopeptidase N